MNNNFLSKNLINNEKGSTIVLALVIMIALTLVGLYSINDSSVETRITRNFKIYKTNLYRAEIAVKEAIQRMEDSSDPSNQINPLNNTANPSWNWIISEPDYSTNYFPMSDDDWNDKDGDGFPPKTNVFNDANDNNSARYIAIRIGYAPSSNLDMTDSGGDTELMYSYRILGRGSVEDNSEFQIDAGYWIRY